MKLNHVNLQIMKVKIKPHLLHIIARIAKRILDYVVSHIDCPECDNEKKSASQS